LTLVYSAHFEHIREAIASERQIKGWSRAKKEALIRGEFDALPDLSKRRGSFARGAPSSFETPPLAAPQDEGSGAAT
jgi:putative endonuclease